MSGKIVGLAKKNTVYTIVDVNGGWGSLNLVMDGFPSVQNT